MSSSPPHIGGIEVRSAELVSELCRQGHDCMVITSRLPATLPAQETLNGALVHRIEFRQAIERKNLRAMLEVRENIQAAKLNFQPDAEVVFVSGPMVALQHMANSRNAVPTIASLQGALQDYLSPGGSVRKQLGACHAIITVSQFLHRAVCGAMPELASKVVALPNSLPTPRCAPQPLPLDPPVILALGRLVHDKGFDLALRAMSRLRDAGSNAVMVIAGDGPERQSLEALAMELRLHDHVRFMGWVSPDRVPELINTASLLVVPSRWEEAFGLVSLQAAQMGRPVVGSRMGATPEIVVHGETGLLFENENVPEFSHALGSLLSSPERMRTMGELAESRAAAEFGFDRYVERYLQVFASLTR
ncbi:glycosyltransferase family 4 protein [Verrucomicrobium spinosum]|uniref:glycosyltransferase family 4 protein n=1 Tax=Verrucomicrobium spinosum TaxID=2736 RepID=UPI00277D143D|nr:glycosyltransferase family 4 protein [Verrucomicrobium spinosum]